MCIKENKRKKKLALLLVIALLVGILGFGQIDVSYAGGGSYRTVNVYPNPSYGGDATAKDGESVSTAYYNDGDSVTVNAVPKDGYTFVRWRNSQDETLSTSVQYSFVITADIDLTAEFMDSNQKYSGGLGTAASPYLVSSPEDLMAIYNDPDKYYKQTANINMSAYTDMTTIGNGETLFTGTYDGNGKTIRNLTIHRPNDPASADGSSYYVGLFNIDTTGIVKDLDIENASIEATGIAGILAGINQGEIINCHVDGTVSATHNNGNAGGLVGINSNLIQGCSAAGSITGNNNIGGLVGINSNSTTQGEIQDSYANVTVHSYRYSGGLAGSNENGTTIERSFAKGNISGYGTIGGLVGNNNGTISNCYASGGVHHISDGENLGGLVGSNGGSIIHSYAYGAVDSSTNSGGLIGFNNDVTNTISRSYYDQGTTGLSDTDKGVGKTTTEMLDQDTYNNWDFGIIWAKQSNTYPYFQWQHSNYPVVGDLLSSPTLALASVSSQTVNLTWSAISIATSYKVYYGTATGVYQEVLSTSNENCTINNLTNDTAYYFVVKALNSSGESLYSNEISATPIGTYLVSIKCVDENSNPLSGVLVTIGSEQVTTTESGVAVFSLPNNSYSVSTSKTGYVSSLDFIMVKGSDDTKQFTLLRDPSLHYLALSVSDAGLNGIAGASVTITTDDKKTNITLETSSNGIAGVYLKDGSYHIKVTKSNYEDYDTTLTINGSDLSRSIILNKDTYLLALVVQDKLGNRVSDATVTIKDSNDNLVTTTQTNENGALVVNVKNGYHSIKIEKDCFDTIQSGVTIIGENRTAYFELNQNAFPLDLVVKDQLGNRVIGATVTIKDSNDNLITTRQTDENGSILVYLKNGYHSIQIEKYLYKTIQSGVTMIGEPRIAYFDLEKDRFLLAINVKNQFGQPVSGAAVTIKDNTNSQIVEQTNEHGWISAYLINGYSSIKVEKDDYETIQTGVTIIGEERTIYLEMNAALFTSYISVKDDSGTPINGAFITVSGDNLTGNRVYQSGTDGIATIELPKGQYMAVTAKDGYASQYSSTGFYISGNLLTYNIAMNRTKYYMPIYAYDLQNNPLVQAMISVKNINTGIEESSSTGTDGRALFFLPNGSYEIAISQTGYVTEVYDSLTVNGADLPNYIFKLNEAPINSSGSSGGNRNPSNKGDLLPSNNKPLSGDAGEKQKTVVEVSRNEVNSSLVRRTDERVVADLSKLDLTKEVSNLDTLANQRQGQNKELLSNGNTENKITLVVPVDADAKEFEVALPDLEKVFEKLDRVSIESDVASFELKKDTFGDLGNDDIVLSASKLDRDSLPDNLKQSLPAGVDEVIDLNAYVSDQKVSQFQEAIEVSIPYTLKDGEDPAKVSFYLLKDSGVIEKVVGMYDAATGKIKVKRTHFSMYFIAVSDVSFADIQNSWAKQQIEVLAGQGIINGKTTDHFDPNGSITRAEFAALIARLLNLSGEEGNNRIFLDIKESAWYQNSVSGLYEAGIVSGAASNTFAPNKLISRQEAATLIANALEYLGYGSYEAEEGRYTDGDAIASWAEDQIETVYQEEIMQGFPSGQFMPNSNLTRAQAAQIIYKLYQKYMNI